METTKIDLADRLNDPRFHGWMAELHWETVRPDGSVGRWAVGSRVTCVGITLTSVPLDAGAERPVEALEVTTRLLRSVPWSTLIANERTALLRKAAAPWADPPPEELLRYMGLTEETATLREWREQWQAVFTDQLPRADQTKKRSGRPPLYPDEMYREVAKIYAAALLSGANPTEAVARTFGRKRTTAVKWVAKARAMFGDEFPPAPVGREGARPKSRRKTQ